MSKTLKVEISGSDEQLEVMAKILESIYYLGSIGASRTIKIWVDGDNSGQIKIKFPELEKRPKIDEGLGKHSLLFQII